MEAGQVFASGAAPLGQRRWGTAEDAVVEMNEAMATEESCGRVEVDEALVTEAGPTVVTIAAGDVVDRSHPTGDSTRLDDGTIQRFLRLEDFESDNGPT